MTVKLSGSLPGGDRDGLGVLHGDLVKDPTNGHYVIALVDCGKTTVEHGAEGDTYTPTVRILNVEAAVDEETAELLAEVLGKLRADRVGGSAGTFDLRAVGE